MIDAGRNIAIKVAAKPLQLETWLLLTAYNSNSSLPYPTVPSPNPCDIPFSHST